MAAAAFGIAAFAFAAQDPSPPTPGDTPAVPPRPAHVAAAEPAPLELRLRAEPAGLSLRLDGRILGPAPQLASAAPGTLHLVEALREGEVVASEQTRGGPGEVRELVLRAAPEEATMRVVSTPSGAYARVDGQDAGVTPVSLTLSAGTHRLELEAEGYARLSTDLQAQAGRDGTVALALAEERPRNLRLRRIARQRTGLLSVRLRRRGRRRRHASVSIDGQPERPLPLIGLRLPVGRHELVLRVARRRPRRRRFRIRRRRHTRLRY